VHDVSLLRHPIFVYIATKRANPVMLDLQGHPLHQASPQAK
jgi:hypothetical protein